ncbi:MAG: glycoside hydrolase domain-containing protein, partial [Tepidisphaeraceae bacterium]
MSRGSARLPSLLLAAGLLVILDRVAPSMSGAAAPEKPVSPARRATLGKEKEPTLLLWLASSLKRIFPSTPPGLPEMTLLAPRNGKVSFQACLRSDRVWRLRANAELAGADDLKPQVRLVGLVPMPHLTVETEPSERDGGDALPGFVPDPLYPDTHTFIGPAESRSYWVTLHIPADAKPGVRELKFRFLLGDHKEVIELPVMLEISEFVIQPRKDFPVIHWWRGEATWDFYKTGMFEDPRWWDITRDQLANMLDHGSDVVYVPMFFDRRETFKRPCQLLIVNETSPGKYAFDWSRVKKFTDLCKQIWFKGFEWSHLWIYWGVENPVRVYTNRGNQYVMLWPPEISGFSDTFMNFLDQFL